MISGGFRIGNVDYKIVWMINNSAVETKKVQCDWHIAKFLLPDHTAPNRDFFRKKKEKKKMIIKQKTLLSLSTNYIQMGSKFTDNVCPRKNKTFYYIICQEKGGNGCLRIHWLCGCSKYWKTDDIPKTLRLLPLDEGTLYFVYSFDCSFSLLKSSWPTVCWD